MYWWSRDEHALGGIDTYLCIIDPARYNWRLFRLLLGIFSQADLWSCGHFESFKWIMITHPYKFVLIYVNRWVSKESSSPLIINDGPVSFSQSTAILSFLLSPTAIECLLVNVVISLLVCRLAIIFNICKINTEPDIVSHLSLHWVCDPRVKQYYCYDWLIVRRKIV